MSWMKGTSEPMSVSVSTSAYFDIAASITDQIEHARKASKSLEGLPDRERIENVVLLGMGDSGAAGDLVSAVCSPFVPVPITVVKGFELPAFVGEGSLVFAISQSGETQEVIDAATEAAMQGAKVVAVSSGGRLCELASSWAAPIVRLSKPQVPEFPAIGALSIPPIAILDELGLFPGANQWIDLAVEQLTNRVVELHQAGNPAEQLADELGGRLVVVYGGGAVGRAAAGRWKSRINANAEVPATWAALPDLAYNDIAGWRGSAEWPKEKVAVVILRHDQEHPLIHRAADVMATELKASVAGVYEVWASGDGELAQLLDLYLLADFVSLHMAQSLNVDPSSSSASDELKSSLSDQ